ncbi:hypothetical protein J5N97_012466 [Dioscorea zingiberensis]|uniref:Beta-glucosidase n=1 Tax=Dioscorea zingiberensis TaxID=325984 RepID=A0A9D5CR42_9LILI|nr:hypothetical protein J5N97_012466 [Dioscorea zingiberensis]
MSLVSSLSVSNNIPSSKSFTSPYLGNPCLILPSVKASKLPLKISTKTTSFPIACQRDTTTHATTKENVEQSHVEPDLGRHSFPPGFTFGAASAAYQVEGAWNEGGREPSVWDTFCREYPESKAFIPENYPMKCTDDPYVEELISNGYSDIGLWANGSWLYVYPQGIKEILLRIKERYGNPPVYVTENGYGDLITGGMTKEEAIADKARKRYYELHLAQVQDALKAGADVKGYFAWSLTDSFEWVSGYTLRFGLNYVDYDTLERTPKESAKWFSQILKKF